MTELTDEAKAEIAEAVRIVASDKNAAELRSLRKHLIPETPENDPPKDGDPNPPPKKEDGDEPPAPPKSGLWWSGERLAE